MWLVMSSFLSEQTTSTCMLQTFTLSCYWNIIGHITGFILGDGGWGMGGGRGAFPPSPLSNWLSLSLIWGCPPFLNFGTMHLTPLDRNPEIKTALIMTDGCGLGLSCTICSLIFNAPVLDAIFQLVRMSHK